MKCTFFVTVITGVLVVILGQILIEYFIRPLQEYRKLKAKVSFFLTLYANEYTNPLLYDNEPNLVERENKAKVSDEIRKLASEVVGYKQQKLLFIKKDNIDKATSSLIGLSNGFFTYTKFLDEKIDQNEKYVENIKDALHLK